MKSGPKITANDPSLNRLDSPSFLALLATQWLTIINDNAFRWFVVGIGKNYVQSAGASAEFSIGFVLAAGTACLVLPYLILAAPSGYVADRFSKRDVIISCKFAEIFIMAIGVGVVYYFQDSSMMLLLGCVALLGAQSAMFSPAKVGIIPEMLREEKIAAANGYFGLSTVTATIVGMALGGSLADFTQYGHTNLWSLATVLVGASVIGAFASLFIAKIPAADPEKKFPFRAIQQTWSDLTTLFSFRDLFLVACGKIFYWFTATMANLNIDAFSTDNGSINESERTPLLISLIVGLGLGSVLAGILSARRIELGMVPFGAIGIVIFSIALFFVPVGFFDAGFTANSGFILACVFLGCLGISAAIFDVPLSSYLQHKSPSNQRGAIIAATNVMLFSGILFGSVVFSQMRNPLSEGSLANVRQASRQGLSQEQNVELASILNDYLSEWERYKGSGENMPEIATYLARSNDEQIYQPLLANLLWNDLIQKKERHLRLPRRETLLKTFDNDRDQRMVNNLYAQQSKSPLMTSRQIFMTMGLIALPVAIFLFWRLPQAAIRFVGWWTLKTIYRVQVNGAGFIPERSGAVMVCNRVSLLDRLLISLSTARRVRWIAFTQSSQNTWSKQWRNFWGEIQVVGGPGARQKAFANARKALKRGELLALFPEEAISSTEQVKSFTDEALKLINVSPVPILPVYFDQLWGSIFSYNRGRILWKWPDKIRRPISINFGQPISKRSTTYDIRNAVLQLGAISVTQRTTQFVSPQESFIRQCKQRKFKQKIGDSSGQVLTGGSLLMRTLILRRLLNRHLLSDDDKYIGVLLPPSAGGVITNMALALDGRVAVNLNYTASADVLNACLKQAGIKHVLTSKRVMDKLDLELNAKITALEEFKDKVTTVDKATCVSAAYAMPASALISRFKLKSIQPNDVLTLIFTSGSTGTPKGVMLTHENVASNVSAIQQVIHLEPSDNLIGILPFFHSFGYTVTLWGTMNLDIGGAYHFTPLDGKQVGRLVRKFKGTVLLATPTFLRSYLKRATKEDFATLDIVVAGAEKLPVELCDAFQEKFGVRPIEGYGATELSPLVSVNVPPNRSPDPGVVDCKEGTVGRPIPNVAAKVLDLDSGEELGANQAGMLWVRGPNLMRGYIGRQDLTDKVVKSGWYNTGDVALIDEDGFIKITGRVSRFSKIGGEMVPHILVEETLAKIIGGDEEEGLKAVVTSVPDEKKGEKLVVVHTALETTAQDLVKSLTEHGLPSLYVPSANAFLQVEEIPVLGTGKLDLHGLKQVAMEKFGKPKE